MYQLHTEKQQKYFQEVIRLHYEEGYGENWIARIIPIGHATAVRWITIFVREKSKITGSRALHTPRKDSRPNCGCQYASREHVALLKSCGIRTGITKLGDPKDNAQAERINNTMKNGLLMGETFTGIGEVIAAVDFYNNH